LKKRRSERACRGPDDDLAGIHIGRLRDGKADRIRDGLGLDGDPAKALHLFATGFVRDALPVAGVGIAAPTSQLDDAQLPAIEDAIRKAADKLSLQLGWEGHREMMAAMA